jgi:hypothetical protein
MKDGRSCYTCKYCADLVLDTDAACYQPKVERLTKHPLVEILSTMGGRDDMRRMGGQKCLGDKRA